MMILLISECTRRGRTRTARIADQFLPRIGRRTWCGNISLEGLARLEKELKTKATKATCMTCHRLHGKKTIDLLWRIGKTGPIDARGLYAIRTSHTVAFGEDSPSPASLRYLSKIVRLAGLFHDLGKANLAFQAMLEAWRSKDDPREAARHEFITVLLLAKVMALTARVRPGEDPDRAFLECLATGRIRDLFDRAWTAMANEDLVPLSTVLAEPKGQAGIEAVTFGEAGPVCRIVKLLCLSHHILPMGRLHTDRDRARPGEEPINGQLDCEGYSRPHTIAKHSGRLKDTLTLYPTKEDDTVPWHNPTWLRHVEVVAGEIVNAPLPCSEEALERGAAILGRFALMAADQGVSSQYRDRIAQTIRRGLHANTARDPKRRDQFLELLPDHLMRVGIGAGRAVESLHALRDAFPSLAADEMPSAILEPSSDKKGPYAWQRSAARAVSKLFKSDEAQGLFAVLMARTGSGKTRAAPIILAATGEPLRYIMGLGLRSLTLQTGREYARKLGFSESAVATIIGSAITRKLDALRAEMTAPVESEPFEDDAPEIVTGAPHSGVDLPGICDWILSGPLQNRNRTKLAAPILVCTIDSVIAASGRNRASHIVEMARCLTSDLVLDEIDDYGAEDLVALARLVHLRGLAGRKVILSSATLSPQIADALFMAYKGGMDLAVALGLRPDKPVRVALLSDLDGGIATHTCRDFAEWNRDYNRFACKLAETLAAQEPRRRAEILAVSRSAKLADLYQEIYKGIATQHRRHHVLTQDGRRISVGVVRLSRVRTAASLSLSLAKHLPKHGYGLGADPSIAVRIVPYVGSLMPVVRWEVEKELDALLNRSGLIDPVLSHPKVLDILRQNPGRDLCIVVITTSLEEVGRDHDFDWAITEPLSTRGIIQLSGRVRRHRHGPVDLHGANVLVLDRPIRLLEQTWRGTGPRDVPPLSYPGIETPFAGKCVLGEHRAERVGRYDAKAILDMATWERSITAFEVISPGAPTSPLCAFERKRLAAMFDGLGYPALSIVSYATGRRSLWIRQTYADRRFRRSVYELAIYPDIVLSPLGRRDWYDHEGCFRNGYRDTMEDNFEVDVNGLLIPMDWIILKERYEALCALLDLDPSDREALKTLLSVSVVVGRSGNLPSLRAHPSVGVFPAPPPN